MDDRYSFGPLTTAGILMGVGMGGFVDGIVFHQIMQVHNMLSARVPVNDLVSAKTNMVWDGYFHAAVWVIAAVGLAMLLKAGTRRDVPWSPTGFWSAWLVGWGLFNLVEGVVDHHILGVHHVLEYADAGTKTLADYGFLASGVVFMVVGSGIIKGAKKAWAEDASSKAGAGVNQESGASTGAYLK